MPKLLNHALLVVSFLAQISFVISWIGFCIPVYFICQALKGNVVSNILDNNNYQVISNYAHVSHAAINHFPAYIYTGLMSIGVILVIIASLYELKALVKIAVNLNQKKYFTAENVKLVWLFIVSQLYTLAADLFLAGANQLTRTYLNRINIGDFSVTWSDIPEDLVALVIISVIYILFKMAEQMKRENELTV
ncbi:MAG: DUF2975 domain-containing protein [Lentilactobacillus hilgardii]|nr:DUF2975 domain-containing protein [Lentilactobacillus hilgardii]